METTSVASNLVQHERGQAAGAERQPSVPGNPVRQTAQFTLKRISLANPQNLHPNTKWVNTTAGQVCCGKIWVNAVEIQHRRFCPEIKCFLSQRTLARVPAEELANQGISTILGTFVIFQKKKKVKSIWSLFMRLLILC